MADLIVIGGGPAGLTAALYAARAGKTVLVLEKNTFGGQITWAPKVENFPTISSISGLELADRLIAQVMDAGVQTELDEAVAVERGEDGFVVKTAFGDTFTGRALVSAVGARPRRLGIEREEEWIGAGISFCAVCDGEFFKDKTVAVCGGGNTALQEALYLSDLCERVYLIHRREQFRADAVLQQAVAARPNIIPVLGGTVTQLHGDSRLTGLTVTADGQRRLEVDGLFVAVGHEPENELLRGLIALDADGYADSDEDCATRCAGLFVAGDCRKKQVRQLTTAMADGAAAALAACRYLDLSK